MKPRPQVPSGLLNSLLRHDPETGSLYWRETKLRPREWNTKYAGKPAFAAGHASGYKWGTLNNRQFLAHRIIWAMVYGEWPDQIDHINGDRADNRIINLRAVGQSDNSKNSAIHKNNKSGFCGVYWSRRWQRWKACIGVNYKHIPVATSKCIAAAVIARHIAEKEHGFHENHGRKQL